jgi:hypothetical protein
MLLTLALLSVLNAPAADSISGTWQIKGDVVGNPLNEVCTIEQEGTTLSGSCAMEDGRTYELAGEVKEGTVTFRHGGEYEGETLTITYSGTLASPTQLSGTVDVQPYGVQGQFTASPVETPAAPAKP